MVFDNLTDLEGLARFAPAAGRCQVVITSNRLETKALGRALTVDAFTLQEALSFLAERTGCPDADGARELAGELGRLPLALAQAAAVIAAQHLNYQTYLTRLRGRPVQNYLKPAEAEPYPHGTAEAILLVLDTITTCDPTGLCRGLIDVISLLSAAGVPRELLHAAGHAGVLRQRTDGTAAAAQDIDEALGRLASASLVTFSIDNSTVTAHRLTMRVARERQAHEGRLAALGAAVAEMLSAVTQSLAEPRQNWPASRDAAQQIMALHDRLTPYLGKDDALTETLLRLRKWALWCLNELGLRRRNAPLPPQEPPPPAWKIREVLGDQDGPPHADGREGPQPAGD